MSNSYEGLRLPDKGGCLVYKNGKLLRPDRSLKVRNHSPTGFEWGYGGSGPAQLSLAIMLEEMETVALAELWYQDFKREVIAMLPGDVWRLRDVEIAQWLCRVLLKELEKR